MKNTRKLSMLIIFALILSMAPPVQTKAAMTEIQAGTEWTGTVEGQKYLTFTPTETGFYDLRFSDTEEVYTYITVYSAKDGAEMGGMGEVDESGNGRYQKNSVYLVSGTSYNLKIECTDGDDSSVTETVTFLISKSNDDIYELTENKEQINAIYSGNRIMKYTPQETSSYTLNLQCLQEEYVDISLCEMHDGKLTEISTRNNIMDNSNSVKATFYMQKDKTYYIEVYVSGTDGEEFPIYVQMSKGKNITSISIVDFIGDDLESNWLPTFISGDLRLQINYMDGTKELVEYRSSNDDVIIDYMGETDSDGHMKYGNQKIKVTYIDTFSDETTVYVKSKLESTDKNLKIDEEITTNANWHFVSYRVTPKENGFYNFFYYTNYGKLDECMDDWSFQIWDSEDREIAYEKDGFKLKTGETYCFRVFLNRKEDNITDFKYYLALDKDHVHTYGDWVITKQATTNSEGEKVRTCTSCDYQETQKIAKIPVSTITPTPAPTSTNKPKVTPQPNKTPKPEKVVKPAKVKKLNAKNKKKKTVSISWSKVPNANGYQIQYANNKKFKGKKSKLVNKQKITIKKLKKKKTYYFRVRAYTLDGKKKIYGKWSTVKKVKIKK